MTVASLRLSVRLLLVVAAVAVLFLLIGGRAGADIPTTEPTVHVVAPGETLWGIAATVAGPEHDLRRVVTEIQELNRLADATIHPGWRLLVPSHYS